MKPTTILKYLLLVVVIGFQVKQTTAHDVQLESKPLFPDTIIKNRLIGVVITQGVVYSSAMTGLYFLYYKDNGNNSFKFYNDNNSWLQMDKMGHLFSSYYLSNILSFSYRFAGVEKKEAVLFGSLLAFGFQLNMEILDGFSNKWGFSWGDILANSTGCILYAGQQLGWNEQRFSIKYSFHPTNESKENPKILGANLLQNAWEDYNGMTFWLSGNIHSFLPKKSRFPKWINVAFGYGIEGMALDPNKHINYRQFYISLDMDLTRIPTKSKSLKVLFTVLNLLKFPFPTLEYNTLGDWKFHYLYF